VPEARPDPGAEEPASLPGYADVAAAHARIAPHVHRTPILTSATVDGRVGAEVFFKVEPFQKTGSFKARGGLQRRVLA
jgi:threonine dehydratase